MYLKTNRRYHRRRGIPFWRLALWLLAPILIFIGIGVYQNRETYIPMVSQFFDRAVVEAVGVVSTIQAPTATPLPDASSTITRAQAAWDQGAFGDAVQLYQSILPAVPNNMQAHYMVTLGLINEGREQEALQAAEDTVTANPFSSDSWAIRAMALNQNGLYGQAIASALRALELNSQNARAHAFLAESFLELGQIERANSEAAQAIELDPDGFEGYYVRGRLTAEANNYDFPAAIKDFQTAYDYSGGMPYIGLDLAYWYIYSDREDTSSVEAGVARLQQMYEKNPSNARVLYQLGSYYRTVLGDLNQASVYLTRCVSAVPDSIDCNYLLGRIQRDQEEPELAAASIAKAIELGSTNPRHYFWAGRTQLDVGNCAAAAEYLEKGYQIAKEVNSEDIGAIEDLIRELSCANIELPTLTPTEVVDPEATPSSDA